MAKGEWGRRAVGTAVLGRNLHSTAQNDLPKMEAPKNVHFRETACRCSPKIRDFGKPAALRGLDITFGLTLTAPSGVRSTPGTTGRGALLP